MNWRTLIGNVATAAALGALALASSANYWNAQTLHHWAH
jgi:hypothetical protein